MKKHIAIATIAVFAAVPFLQPVWGADTATDSSMVKLQSASIPALRQSVASSSGYVLDSIEITHNAHQMTATIVNSKQNSASSADRATDATAIVAAMEKAMVGKPEYNGVAAIHIDYIDRTEGKGKTLQAFDFFRSPANAFVLHKS